MRKNISISLIISLILSLSACSVKKSIPTTANILQDSVPYIATIDSVKKEVKHVSVNDFQSTEFNFNTLILKGKGKLNIDNKENDVNITMRIKKDEQIWVSVSAIIGEVARVLITPDTVKIINRLEGNYIKKPFNFIQEFTNKQMDYSVLQSILIGNSIQKFISDSSKIEDLNSYFLVSGLTNDINYKFTYNSLKRLEQTDLIESNLEQELSISYASHNVYNGLMFPGKIQMKSRVGKKLIGVQLQFSSINYNVPVEFPFTVPSRYEVIN